MDISPLKVREMPPFLRALRPVLAQLASGDVLGALAEHADCLIEAVAIGARVDREWLSEQPPDVLVQLASQIVAANVDFFARRVMPELQEGITQIEHAMRGIDWSSISLAQASPTTR